MSVKCLSFHIDSDVSFTLHISKTVSSCFSVLRQIRSVCRFLTIPLLITLLTALVLPRIDYCISVLFDIPLSETQRLQHVLHAFASLIFGATRFSSITPLLRELKWFPIKARIEYRLSILAHLCRRGLAPQYVLDTALQWPFICDFARLLLLRCVRLL